MKPFQAPNVVKNTEGEIFVQLLTVTIEHTIQHFEDNQFMNPAMKNRLIHNAVPTMFDIPNPPPKLTPK